MTESTICKHELPLAQCGVCSPRMDRVPVKSKVTSRPIRVKQHPKVTRRSLSMRRGSNGPPSSSRDTENDSRPC